MLDAACFAFLILTGEDQHGDGEVHARENVIHETGLFQGRLGFERAIVLLEEGCKEFSNIHGLTQIRFPKGHISACFEEIRRVLEREQIPGAGKILQAGASKAEPTAMSMSFSHEQAMYLMELSRPRNQSGISDIFDLSPSRNREKYRTMIEVFIGRGLVRLAGNMFLLTEGGCEVSDKLWQIEILRALDRPAAETTQRMKLPDLATAVSLTDGKAEADELERHLIALETHAHVVLVRQGTTIDGVTATDSGLAFLHGHLEPG